MESTRLNRRTKEKGLKIEKALDPLWRKGGRRPIQEAELKRGTIGSSSTVEEIENGRKAD